MNNKSTARIKYPLWVAMLFVGALVLAASAYGFSAYQKKQASLLEQSRSSLVKKQQEILLKQSDVIDTNWLHTLNPLVEDVQGRLIWSSEKQIGVVLFNDLPALESNHYYHLYIYDLEGISKKAISGAKFKPLFSGQFEKIFKPERLIHKPFKFELTLEKEGVAYKEPLLLAQP